jgi:hypothetical protein
MSQPWDADDLIGNEPPPRDADEQKYSDRDARDRRIDDRGSQPYDDR